MRSLRTIGAITVFLLLSSAPTSTLALTTPYQQQQQQQQRWGSSCSRTTTCRTTSPPPLLQRPASQPRRPLLPSALHDAAPSETAVTEELTTEEIIAEDIATALEQFAFVAIPDEEAVALSQSKTETKTEAATATPVLTSQQVKTRLETQLAKLQAKDATSFSLTKEQIDVVFEDDHVVAVNKPAGQLCVPNKHGYANLATSVGDAYGCGEFPDDRPDRMVVHRLGMETSGLVILAKTLDAVRGLNAIFRARKIERKYEALVCGHIEQDVGLIHLPLMRDYEYPPYMRISTDQHQRALIDLDPALVGKKLLEQPKDSLTKFEVLARETYGDAQLPVTRVELTSISGRTHQLNAHLAAFGHPIVGDTTYGIFGAAAANGGLSDTECTTLVTNPARASTELQEQIAKEVLVQAKKAAAAENNDPDDDGSSTGVVAPPTALIHAKSLKFIHPVTKEEVAVSMDAPF